PRPSLSSPPFPTRRSSDLTAMAASIVAPGHVPIPATPLVGRDPELATLGEHLTPAGPRLITLTGLMGVGKTHLARTAALAAQFRDRKSTRLNSSHGSISYA